MTWTGQQQQIASRWKATTPTLPGQARADAPYVDKDGRSAGPARPYVLPREHAALSLLPEVRTDALTLFAELGIPWHAGISGGPSNHLLSSQVQCVNALGQMVHDPERLVRAFAEPLGTAEVLEVEPGRWLTFEYIGPQDCFGEAPGADRVRGARCTSVDAAFLHRTTDGVTELVLLEWKFTESYRRRRPDPAKDAVRWQRYGAARADPTGPITDALPFADVLDEPLYQLVRQQLLAHRLERAVLSAGARGGRLAVRLRADRGAHRHPGRTGLRLRPSPQGRRQAGRQQGPSAVPAAPVTSHGRRAARHGEGPLGRHPLGLRARRPSDERSTLEARARRGRVGAPAAVTTDRSNT